jgi:crotonobetainyl-CoA:carnitine CoA-transferase CaiB-like acyl-CoA transferase
MLIMCMSEKFWTELLRAIGQEKLASDPRFVDGNTRHKHRHELTEILDSVFRGATTAEWLARLSGVLPVAPVYDVAEALSSPFARESDMIQTVEHPAKPDLKLLASPIKVNGERAAIVPCPALGADNDALLGVGSGVR